MTLNLSGKLTASTDVLSREIHGETVLLDLKTETYFGLGAVGARVWQLLSSGTSVPELIDVLASEYDVSRERLSQDIERLVSDLMNAGLVTAQNG